MSTGPQSNQPNTGSNPTQPTRSGNSGAWQQGAKTRGQNAYGQLKRRQQGRGNTAPSGPGNMPPLPTRPDQMPPLPPVPPPRQPVVQQPVAPPPRPTVPARTLVKRKRGQEALTSLAHLSDEIQKLGKPNAKIVDVATSSSSATAIAEKTRVGLSKDKQLIEASDRLSKLDSLVKNGDLAGAVQDADDLSKLIAQGRASAEKERKSSVVPATKDILKDRVEQYDALEVAVQTLRAEANRLLVELTHQGNELCHEVSKMLADFDRTQDVDILNGPLVGALKKYLAIPQVPPVIATLGLDLLAKADQKLLAARTLALQRAQTQLEHATAYLDFVPDSTGGEPASGTSEVVLIRDFDDKVKFAFKPVEGESGQNDGDTLREVLTSEMCRRVGQLIGVDLGFPEVSAVSIDGRSGALIEGLGGVLAATEGVKTVADEDKKKADDLSKQLPVREMQKVMLSSFITGDLDMKWDNLFMDTQGQSARRFDGGKGFPGPRQFGDVLIGEVGGSRKMASPDTSPLFFSPYGKERLTFADAPMGDEFINGLRQARQGITQLKADMKKVASDACGAMGTTAKPQQIEDETMDRTVATLESLIDIVDADPTQTMAEIYKKFVINSHLKTAADYLRHLAPKIAAVDGAAVQQWLAAKGMTLAVDLDAAVQGIQAILAGGSAGFDDNVHSAQLHDFFRDIDRVLAVQDFMQAQPQDVNLDKWCNDVDLRVNQCKIPETQQAIRKAFLDAIRQLPKDKALKLLTRAAMLEATSGTNISPVIRPGDGQLTVRIDINADPAKSSLVTMPTSTVRVVVTGKNWKEAQLPTTGDLKDWLVKFADSI